MDTSHMSKSKKSKKPKKVKKVCKKGNNSSDNSSEAEWVESTDKVAPKQKNESPNVSSKATTPPVQRDSWMDIDDIIPTVTRDQLREKKVKPNDEKSLRTLDKPGQHSRELNPYWKDGGKGLPAEEKVQNKITPAVGDGGVNWLRKAYQRVHEQAEEEGRTPEAVASERWGSLENLESLIAEAEKNTGRHGTTGNRYHQDINKRDDRYGAHGGHNYDRNERDKRYTSYKESRKYDQHDSGNARRNKKSHFQKPGDDFERKHERSSRSYDKRQPRWLKPENQKKEISNPQEIGKPSKPNKNDNIVKQVEKSSPIEDIPTKKLEPKLVALSEKEMNVLGAKILKAELMGNTAMATKLKGQMELALASKEMGVQPAEDSVFSRKNEVVVLTQSNARGMSRPLQEPETSSSEGRRRKIKVATHDNDGKRVRYFHDDEKYSLKEMFEREKFTTADDETAMYLKMAAKNRPKTDSDYDIDDAFIDKASRAASTSRESERTRSQAIREHQNQSFATENCYQCLVGRNNQKHLIIAFGQKAYLSLPYHESLTEGHCLIVPMNHVPAATFLDEDVWSEIQLFRKTLTIMFQDRGYDTVFMETSLKLRQHPHMVIECIPMEQEVGMEAPMYFKKAILESESEWAQNVKLVDLSKKDIRHSVPKELPYFSVDFGMEGGFAHVVEDEGDFPVYFGKEIVGGMLDVEPRLWLKPRKDKFDDQRKKVLKFNEWWKPYDWTTKIKTGNSDSE